METQNEQHHTPGNKQPALAATQRSEANKTDLPDSDHDAARLQPEETTIDLPDVKDIPGQEFVHVAPLGELADTTIASADEEGEGLFDDDVRGAADDATPGTNVR